MAVLVVAEHDNAALRPATLNALSAALQLKAPVTMLVAGAGCRAAAEAAACCPGVAKVMLVDHASLAHALAENAAPLVAALAKDFTHVIAAATTFGKNVLPRAAALLDTQQISEITAIVDAETFVRPIYAGNALATVRSKDKIKMITVRGTAFAAAPATGGGAPIEDASGAADSGMSRFLRQEVQRTERPELTAARIVVSGGRGMANGENFKIYLEPLADKLGAAVGASRAAVDAGFVPNDYQVGQTGKVVAPDLYLAIGISGAIQHLAGMKDSKVIVAVNKDEEAPIFQIADYGLVGDLFKIVPELTAALPARK
jgi:electron transfer flavoprotein alpha subunit